jgi:hypothetical protein
MINLSINCRCYVNVTIDSNGNVTITIGPL